MATASQVGTFSIQEFSSLGIMLVAGRVYTYVQGTTTQKTAYTDKAGTIPHTYTADGLGGQYIALDARGELPAPLYFLTGSADIALKDATGATIWTRRADPIADSFLPPFAFGGGTPGAPPYGFSGGAGTGMYSPAPNQIAWSAGSVQRMLLDDNGTLTINEPGAGPAFKPFGTANQPAVYIQGSATVDQSIGLQIFAGTTSLDNAVMVQNVSGSQVLFRIRGNGEITGRGIPFSRYKSGTTTIVNNSTLAIDPFLQASLPIGTYAFELWAPVWATAANSLRWAMAFSGVASNFFYAAQYTTGGAAGQTGVLAPGAVSFGLVVSASAAGADWMKVEGTITVTSTGVLSLQEAQNTNNANAINIGQGAWMKVTQVS